MMHERGSSFPPQDSRKDDATRSAEAAQEQETIKAKEVIAAHHQQEVERLLEMFLSERSQELLERLETLPREIGDKFALALIEAGHADWLALHLEHFDGLGLAVAADLIDARQIDAISFNIKRFRWDDHREIAKRLIDIGEGHAVARSLPKFKDIDHKEVALGLIETGLKGSLIRHLELFNGLDREVAMRLIESGEAPTVAVNIRRFTGLDREVAFKLIEKHQAFRVMHSLDAFAAMEPKELALKLIETNQASAMRPYPYAFPGMDRSIMWRLIELDMGDIVENLDHSAEDVDPLELATKLLEHGRGKLMSLQLYALESLPAKIAWKLVEAEGVVGVIANIGKFQDLDQRKIALRIIARGEGTALLDKLEKFTDLDHRAIISPLIESGCAYWVVYNHRKIKGISRRELAMTLIAYGEGELVADHPDIFPEMDDDMATKMVESLLRRGLYAQAEKATARYSPAFPPDSIAAIATDRSVPLAIRRAKETYEDRLIGPQHQRARLTHAMSPSEFSLAVSRYDHALAESQEPLKDAYETVLRINADIGGENAAIERYMREFGDLFGPELAMRYANRPDLPRHDAYMSIPDVQTFLLQQTNESSAVPWYELLEQGWQNKPGVDDLRRRFSKVLMEVAMDDTEYEGAGAAQRRFNEVIRSLRGVNLGLVLDSAADFGIPALTERVAKLRDARFDPLSSWKGLKDAAELVRLLEKRDLLEELRSERVPEAVQRYASALLSHPSIAMVRIREFVAQPERFLDAEGKFVSEDLQRSLSPARMLDVERLGLTAEELRDSLADGTLDRLQILPPAEASYRMDRRGNDLLDASRLRAEFDRAIGRRKERIRGEAKDPLGLFNALATWGKEFGLSKEECGAWIRGDRELPPEADLAALYVILHDPRRGVAAEAEEEVRVRIGKKSDPSMIVAGNDTASCMPFGDGKTNVYAWGPGFAQLVVERKNEHGEWRTMAQSVLSLDFDAGRPSSEVIEGLRRGQRLNDLVEAESFSELSKLVCDNIEPSPNDIDAGRAPLIEKAYERFLRDYLREHAPRLDIDPREVIVGKETYLETDRWSFPKVKNTFVPLAPLSYTDNAGKVAYRIETGLPPNTVRRGKEITTMTAADVMPMAFMEAKNYADNPDLVFGLFDRQHKIVGGAIAAERHGDPKLSLMSRDDKGKPVGYIMAYMDRTTTVPEVFIDDMAVDRSRGLLAARHAIEILDAFLERYTEHYRSSDTPFPPIYAQMRESTSYRLVTRQAEAIAKRFGLAIDVKEEGETSMGGETFRMVRIFVGHDAESLAGTKEAWEARTRLKRDRGEGGASRGYYDDPDHDYDTDQDDEGSLFDAPDDDM